MKRNKELLEQMRALLVSYGWKTVEQAKQISLEEARLFLVALGMWDAATDEPTELAASLKLLRTELQTRKLLTIRQIGEERDMEPAQIQARYAKLSAQLHQEQERQEEEAAQAAQAEAERLAEAERQEVEAAQAGQAETERQAPEAAQEDPSRREDEEEAPGSLGQHEVARWMTLEEFAENLRAAGVKKTPEAIKNWLRPDANAPRRFEPNEWMSQIDNGKRVIFVDPAAALRISRALKNQKLDGGSEGARARRKGDSNPRLSAVTATPVPEEAKIEAETGIK